MVNSVQPPNGPVAVRKSDGLKDNFGAVLILEAQTGKAIQ